jgi:hypothetical protein
MLFRCDGTADCEDYTDEIGCEVTTLCDPKTVFTYNFIYNLSNGYMFEKFMLILGMDV